MFILSFYYYIIYLLRKLDIFILWNNSLLKSDPNIVNKNFQMYIIFFLDGPSPLREKIIINY